MFISNGEKSWLRNDKIATAKDNNDFVDIWFDYLGKRKFIAIAKTDIEKLVQVGEKHKNIKIRITIDEPLQEERGLILEN